MRTRLAYHVLMIFLFLAIAFDAVSQSENYFINGSMKGLNEGEAVYLKVIHADFGKGGTLKDSARVKNGSFQISGHFKEGAEYCMLNFSQHKSKLIRLLIDNKDHLNIVSSNIDSIPHDFLDNYIRIEGSKVNATFYGYLRTIEYFSQNLMRIKHQLQIIKDSIGFDASMVDGVLAAKNEAIKGFYSLYLQDPVDTGYLSQSAIPFLVWFSGFTRDMHLSFSKEIYDKLTEKDKKSYYGKILASQIPLSVGQYFPEFTLPASDNKPLVLKQVLQKNKLTIVHFWAVNSVIRKEYQNDLKMLYNKYSKKGLGIVGVSSDDSASEYNYRKLLREEAFPWPNVCDFKGREGVVETVYQEYGYDDATHNTTNVLIDQDGKIVAWDPTGVELQWYLRK